MDNIKVKKFNRWKMILIKARLAMTSGQKRTKYLEKAGLFAKFGKDCFFCTRVIPSEPYMIKIHNNVVIAANVTFITHDIMNDMLARKEGAKPGEMFSEYQMGTIEIFDNVAIGANTTILYNTKIGPDAIVAAGSVVTKDVPQGTIVAGNPARVIGKLDNLIEKRKSNKKGPTNQDSIEEIMNFYW